jgi:hypothetical protein
MADFAAVALLQERSVRESHGVVAQLQGALSSRLLIEKAKGVLADAHRSVLTPHFRRCATMPAIRVSV